MRLTPTRPVKLKTSDGPRVFKPGETFEADEEKAKPFIEQGLIRPATEIQDQNVQDRQEIDRFFVGEILPRLSRLHIAGKLPSLTEDPKWAGIEAEWQKAASDSLEPCDMERVKQMMLNYVYGDNRIP